MGPVLVGETKRKQRVHKEKSPYSRPSRRNQEEEVIVLEDLGLPESAKNILGENVAGKKKRRLSHTLSSSSSESVKVLFEAEGKEPKQETSGEQSESRESKPKKQKDQTKTKVESVEDMVDYYKILELPRSATVVDIKKSYRKLALRWHPDKNPGNIEEATKKFREISEAYEVLVDDKKRSIYDQFGKEGLAGNNRPSPSGPATFDFGFPSFGSFGFGFPGFSFRDPEEVFREFFRGDPMADLMDSFFEGTLFPGSRTRSNNRNQGGYARQQEQSLSTSFFQPFGFGMFNSDFDSMFQTHDEIPGNSFFSSTTFRGAGSVVSPSVKRTSTSTKMVNGKKITTKKVIENGVETVTVTENGVLKSKTVDGVPQAIAY